MGLRNCASPGADVVVRCYLAVAVRQQHLLVDLARVVVFLEN